MGTELDVATLAISLALTVYLLITHVLHYWKSVKSTGSSGRSTTNLHRRRRKNHPVEFALILTFIILDIVYFLLKYRAHVSASHVFNIHCSTITAAYLSVMATSIWTVELFFLVRGWRILREMSSNAKLLDIDENALMIYDVMCRIGIVFVVLCSVITVVLVTLFVEYEEVDGLCVPTGKYKQQITMSAFSLMACAVSTGVMALFAFAKPLVQYQTALIQRSKSYATDEDEAGSEVIQRNDTVRLSLKRTLIRVCVCLCAVHVMFLISGVFHVLVNEPEAWGYGSRKIYRSLYCGCSVLMIVSMEMTYQNWRQRLFPFTAFCGRKK